MSRRSWILAAVLCLAAFVAGFKIARGHDEEKDRMVERATDRTFAIDGLCREIERRLRLNVKDLDKMRQCIERDYATPPDRRVVPGCDREYFRMYRETIGYRLCGVSQYRTEDLLDKLYATGASDPMEEKLRWVDRAVKKTKAMADRMRDTPHM